MRALGAALDGLPATAYTERGGLPMVAAARRAQRMVEDRQAEPDLIAGETHDDDRGLDAGGPATNEG